MSINNQYLEMKIQTASPEELVGMLYEGAIRFMRQAVNEMDSKDWHKTNTSITRAQNIISELNITLDRSKGGDIAKNLSRIYDYLNSRLVEANIKKDPKMVGECIKLIGELNSAWSQVVKDVRSSNKAGVNLAS